MLEKQWVTVCLRKRLDQNTYKLSRDCFICEKSKETSLLMFYLTVQTRLPIVKVSKP